LSLEHRKKPKNAKIGMQITASELRKLGHLQQTTFQRGTWVIEEIQVRKDVQLNRLNSRGSLVPSKKVDIEVAILRNTREGTTTRTLWIA